MLMLKRLGAYIIDCIILFFIITLINVFIPVNGDINKLSNKLLKLSDDYIEEKISVEELRKQNEDINYEISKATYVSSIASIGVYLLYFVVFQAYNNGQTFGKKIFKIQVLKSDNSLVDINTLLIRCLIPYDILVNFILVILILFVSKPLYINISNVLNFAHMIIMVITLFMMMIKSRGIHDVLAKTKVEQV